MAIFKNDDIDGETDTLVRDRIELPKKYKVLMHNDDATPMDFVIQVLKGIFRKSQAEAIYLTLQIHNEGIGLCGVYTKEIAEAKVEIVRNTALQNQFPLSCTMEEE